MGKKRSLSEAQQAQIVILHQEGYIELAISERLAVSKTAVHQAVVKFKHCGSYSDCKRSGRPRKTPRRDDILIKRCVVKSPTCSATKIRAERGETGSRISRRTISRCLNDKFGLKSWKPARKPRLTPAMKLKRLQFAKKYRDWTSQRWSRVLFSDETIQQFALRKRTVRRPPGTRYNERFTQQTMKHPPSVMIWGAISTQGTAGLLYWKKCVPVSWTMQKVQACMLARFDAVRILIFILLWTLQPHFTLRLSAWTLQC